MRVFVTGATGFIGGHVVRLLLEQGDEVTALVRSAKGHRCLAARGVRIWEGDLTAADCVRRGMEGAEAVFHLAAWYRLGPRDLPTARAANVGGTRNVLSAMREHGVRKGVYTSTVAVFGDTRGRVMDETYRHAGTFLSVYDRTKWEAHYEVALPAIEEGLPLVIVQPGLVYGPGDPSLVGVTLRQYLRRRLSLVPARTAFCWGHVEDTARGHLLAMEKGRAGEAYVIAGPPHTLVDALTIARGITGIPAPAVHASPLLLRWLAGMVRPLERILPLPDSYRSESLRVLAGATYLASNEKARRELGLAMRPLREGLRDTLEAELRAMTSAGRGLRRR